MDTEILANVTNQHPENHKFLADLKKQVQQWISFEKQSGVIARRAQNKEWTVFTVFFGISDIWQYTFQDNKASDDDINETMASLFAQLDVIAQHTQTRPHIVLPRVIDISFLPAFAQQPVEFPDRQQSAVSLTEKWNNALEKAARDWTGGYVHLLETDKWLLKMIREQQMNKIGIADERGEGKGNPRFSEVRSPCVPLPHVGAQFPFDMSDTASNRTEPCEDESHYLFWSVISALLRSAVVGGLLTPCFQGRHAPVRQGAQAVGHRGGRSGRHQLHLQPQRAPQARSRARGGGEPGQGRE